jgi:predicted  nucleic acid-binding Zn-ribbon protein
VERLLHEGRAQIEALLARSATLESELSSLQRQCDALQQRLQGNRQSNYESAAAQKELDQLVPRRSAVEEELLAAMLELEDLQPRMPPWQEQLDEVLADLQVAEVEERERLENLDARLGDLEAARGLLVEQLGTQLAEQYENARKQHPQPVSEGRNGRCGRCRMGLSDQEIRQLRLGEAQLCTACGSLLVASLV